MNMTKTTTEHQRLSDNSIGDLNDLIDINFESEKGFRDTADNLQSTSYVSAFREIAEERQQQAKQLQSFITRLGDDANGKSNSLLAQAHRWWADIREAVSNSDNYVILAEAERGEDRILHLYQDVVDKLAGTAAYDLVSDQLAQVKKRHDMIRDARDREKQRENK